MRQNYKFYTKDEIEYLKNNYTIKSNSDLAKHLDRTCLSIRNKLNELKLIRNKDNLIGKKFKKLLALERIRIEVNRHNCKYIYKIRCKCDCGNEILVGAWQLVHRNKSCGCSKNKNTDKTFGSVFNKYFNSVKSAAKSRKIIFTITLKYVKKLFIKQKNRCKLSGLKLVFNNKKNYKGYKRITASLDRIDSKKGYIEGNVQWIHKDINYMKCDYNQKYFINICKLITKKQQIL